MEFIIYFNGKIFSHIQQNKKLAAETASNGEDMHQQRSHCQANASASTILLPSIARERNVLIVSANYLIGICKSQVYRKKNNDV